jgi:hypothetical protein
LYLISANKLPAMKWILLSLAATFCVSSLSAQDADKIKELEGRIQILEGRIANTEPQAATLAQPQEQQEVVRNMQLARARMAEDKKRFKAKDIAAAEDMYQKAARNVMNATSTILLKGVVSEYSQLNRAGCAQLYLARHAGDAEKETLLLDCIRRFSNCYYGDGIQVGPYAMFSLAQYYRDFGREEESEKLAARIRKECAAANDHEGRLLVSRL